MLVMLGSTNVATFDVGLEDLSPGDDNFIFKSLWEATIELSGGGAMSFKKSAFAEIVRTNFTNCFSAVSGGAIMAEVP